MIPVKHCLKLSLLSFSVASSNSLLSKSFFLPHVDHLSWPNITISENFCFGNRQEFQMWGSHAEDSSNCYLKYWSIAWSVPGMGVGELVGFGSSLWVTEPVLPLTVRASWDINPFKALTTCLGIVWCSSAVCPSACLNSFWEQLIAFHVVLSKPTCLGGTAGCISIMWYSFHMMGFSKNHASINSWGAHYFA